MPFIQGKAVHGFWNAVPYKHYLGIWGKSEFDRALKAAVRNGTLG